MNKSIFSKLSDLLHKKQTDSPLYAKEIFAQRYKVELELIDGTHVNTNTHPSIIHYSFNKAATQYVKSVLHLCANEIGMVSVDINGYAFDTDFPFLDKLSANEFERYHHIFKPNGYLYSLFGGVIDGIPNLSEYKIIFVVRDPRDLLVSEYYSTAYSHPEPNANSNKHNTFMKNRNSALTSTIDQYVLRVSSRLHNTFIKYNELLHKKHQEVCILKYEDMLKDFEGWLDRLLVYCDFHICDITRDTIITNNQAIKPKNEDPSRHNRKGVAGDYKEKLQEATITYLNEMFSDVLEQYGYTR